jgi:tetratricopeptide (TPR) repeat protein
MGIKALSDRKYLNVRLKELYQQDQIEYMYHNRDIYWKINKFAVSDEWNLSLDFYSEMVDKDTNDINAWSELGLYYHEFQQYNEAIHCFEAVINLDPFDAITWMLLGNNYSDLKQIESSIKCYENAFDLIDYELEMETFFTISISLAGIYLEQDDYNKSLKILNSLLDFEEDLKPSELVFAYNLIAINYVKKQEFVKVIEPMEKALAILPDNKKTEETLKYIEIHAFNYQKKYGVSPFSIRELNSEDYIILTDTTLEIIDKLESHYDNESESSFNSNDNQNIIKKEISVQMLREFKEFRKSFEKSSEKRDLLLIKSYIDNFIQFFFEKPTKKQIAKVKVSLENVIKGFPDDMRNLVSEEYSRTLEQYKFLMPKKWKKYGKALINLIPLLR